MIAPSLPSSFNPNQLFYVSIVFSYMGDLKERVFRSAYVRPQGDLMLIWSMEDGCLIVSWADIRFLEYTPKSFESLPLEETVRSMGKCLEAIKKVREVTGYGLKEAKDYCDKIWNNQ